MSLADRIKAGDRGAVAEALNLVDDRRPAARAEAAALLAELESAGPTAGAWRIGLTGAPGAGKSTLLDAMIRRRRAAGERVAAVAVDPSSARTGGALLGDRVRVRSSSRDPDVLFRSLAARDRLGGLAEAARASVIVLASAFDVVFVETVGVGQSEGEVVDLVDTLLFLAQPGAGDLLQFMKAGVLELPDCFAVGKADQGPQAARSASELEAGLGLGERASAWQAPVVVVSAQSGEGLDALDVALEAHRAFLAEDDRLAARRRAGRDRHVHAQLASRYGRYGLEAIGGPDAVDARLAAAPDASGAALARTLGREIEEALHKTAPEDRT